MKKILMLIVAVLAASNLSLAQQRQGFKKVKISGTVLDKDTNQPLEYATVSLQHTQRANLLTGGITDEQGAFEIEIFPGTYNIKVEYISFKSVEIKDKQIRGNMDLGPISLQLDVAALDEVEVVAERTQVEIRLDKKIYNVGKDLTVKGGTISDVLDNVPSVSVDVEGNVSLRGNDNVRILINGKPSGLVGLSSTDALRQLPADAIEKVEVITSPSARYDAEGTVGILNIILKRGKAQGLNGSVSVNTGVPDNHGASVNLNYRSKNFNLFNTSGYNYREVPGNAENNSENFFSDNRFIEEDRNFDRIRKGFNTNLGLEYFLSDKITIINSVFYRNSNNSSTTDNNTLRFDPNRALTSRSLRIDNEDEEDKTFQYSFNYSQNFKKDGHTLTVDFQVENSQEDEFSIITEEEFIAATPDELENVQTLEDQSRILLQADYVLPIGENAQFEAGYRGNFRELDTDFSVDTLNINTGVLDRDTNLSNRLIYDEDVNAFYSQFGSKVGKLSFLLGLRTEVTNVVVNQVTTNDVSTQNYTSLFPTVNLGYEFNQTESITFGYNRRIRRPRSRFINPFPSRSSEANLFQGNPDIQPAFTNGFDLGYLKRWKKFTFNGSIFYQRSTDVFQFITFTDPDQRTDNGDLINIRFPTNLSTNDRYGVEFTLSYSPYKWWRLNGNFNLFYSVTDGDFTFVNDDGDEFFQNFDNSNVSWFARLNSTINLPAKIDWQTRLFYRGPNENAQTKTQGLFSLNLAFSKDVLKDKGSISLNISDVFNSSRRRSETLTDFNFIDSEFQFRQTTARLAFTYRFNQSKRDSQRRNRRGQQQDFEEGEEFGRP
ncbi:TonB-dependent receptor [Leptobacterium flavescens]|uniref:TonB-dependent receptor n=1 Tax=Leptobacterium flavescens TaxID=472055 RepID=A0A6P0UPF8_9FLAO|nr:TonB-dependent receptor [Leptobacterium flavescens]NER13848.1 TonB-dependent receptor [Leptobacterium flavescens]